MKFKGQSAVVVGGSRGFGRGVVERLMASGMTVTAVARNARDLEELTRETSAKIIVADATDEQASERILSETKPNLLVLSAGTILDHCTSTHGKPFRNRGKLTQNSPFFGSKQCCGQTKAQSMLLCSAVAQHFSVPRSAVVTPEQRR